MHLRAQKCSNWALLSILAHFNPVVSIRNVAKWCLVFDHFWSHLDHLPRVFQTVVPAALRKSPYITILEKSRNSTKWTFEDVPQARATAAFWSGMLQWKSKFGCGSSFVHVCVQDAPQIPATASFWSGMLYWKSKCSYGQIVIMFGQPSGMPRMAWVRSGQKGVQLKPYGSKSAMALGRCT
jgi:hypothetical protein